MEMYLDMWAINKDDTVIICTLARHESAVWEANSHIKD